MRLPNGYGSVYKLSGNRRNPWIVRITMGFDDEGNQIRSTIGYYPTRQKALQVLAEFNDNPYDLELSKVTFAEIYQRWYNDNFKHIEYGRGADIMEVKRWIKGLLGYKHKTIYKRGDN